MAQEVWKLLVKADWNFHPLLEVNLRFTNYFSMKADIESAKMLEKQPGDVIIEPIEIKIETI